MKMLLLRDFLEYTIYDNITALCLLQMDLWPNGKHT